MALINNWDLTTGANDTVGSAHLTNNGSVTFGADGAIFNGTSQWLNATLAYPDTFSLVAIAKFYWPKITSSPAAWGDGSGKAWTGFWYSSGASNGYVYNTYSATAAGDYTSTNYPADKFVLITTTVSAIPGTIKLYRNANLLATGTASGRDTTTTFSIGRGGLYASSCFQGNIKTVSLYNHELSLSEIAELVPSTAAASFHQSMTGGM